MKNIVKLLINAGVIFLIMACLSPYNGNDGKENGLPGNETTIAVSDLFIPIDNTTITKFYTNDPIYRTASGYTLWTYCSDIVNFQERIVTVRKPLGSNIAGYGLILCANERMVEESLENVFLTVMINNNRQYALGKVIRASYKPILNWTEGNGLAKGIGLPQKIKIVKDGENQNKYHLYFNGFYECFFIDEEDPRCEGVGKNGYVVVIAQDDLNKGSVEVLFDESL